MNLEESGFAFKAKCAVTDYINRQLDDHADYIYPEDVKIVWQVKALQNFKATLIDGTPSGLYYEATWNGDKKQMYLDIYKKIENIFYEK